MAPTETTMARAITQTERNAFARDGYVVLRAFYTEKDIARLNAALAAAPLPTVDEVGRQLARDSFIWRRSPRRCELRVRSLAPRGRGGAARNRRRPALCRARGQTP